MTDPFAGVPDPVIRDAVDADGPALAAVIAGVFAEYDDCPFVPDEFPELAAPASHFAGRSGTLWVVENDGVLVGSLGLAPSWRPGDVELFKVYLDRSWRGRGLAGALLQRALAWAANAGAARMLLWSDTRFRDGHRFYRRQGFRQLPGARALHDVGRSLEFSFCREL